MLLSLGVADNPQKMIDLKDNFTYYVPLELKLKRDDPKSLKFGEGLKDLYFENRPTSKETIPDYVRVGGGVITFGCGHLLIELPSS